MSAFGQYALLLAFIGSLYTAAMGLYANRHHRPRLQESVRGAAVAVALAMTSAACSLEYLLLSGDYSVAAVYNHSDRALPLIYKMGALWGGDSGSILFWGLILSLYLGGVALFGGRRNGRVTSMVIPLLGAVMVFFTFMSRGVVDPFRLIAGNPQNGIGLDPLLQNVVMTIHPPMMYTGLIGMTVPAAYLVAGMWTEVSWRELIPTVRRWMLLTWGTLGVALILGGMWAYMELGWGGYWEWDPVENAALLPWLTATAFLHSAQLEEKRGVFRLWTVGLGLGTFVLTLVATYITRSGVLKNSVHSFTGTGVGPYFVILFWVSVIYMVSVLWIKRERLEDRGTIEGTVSKESAFLLLNVSFVAIATVVLLGTFYPVISKALWQRTVILNEAFFNHMTVPFFLVLVALMGLMPSLGWGMTRLGKALRAIGLPVSSGVLVVIYAWHIGDHEAMALIGLGLVAYASTAVLREFFRAARRQQSLDESPFWIALVRAIQHRRRRYGGYIAHLAFLLVVCGVIGSHTHAYSETVVIAPGHETVFHGNHIRYQSLENIPHSGYVTTAAVLHIVDGQHHWQARPGLSFFPGSAEPVAQVSIHQGLMQNLYVVLEGSPGDKKILLEVMVNPMVTWIWIGMVVLALGTVIALSAPGARRMSLDSSPSIAGTWEIISGESAALKGPDPL